MFTCGRVIHKFVRPLENVLPNKYVPFSEVRRHYLVMLYDINSLLKYSLNIISSCNIDRLSSLTGKCMIKRQASLYTVSIFQLSCKIMGRSSNCVFFICMVQSWTKLVVLKKLCTTIIF